MRIWKQAQDLSNSVHCLSNGDICIYEKGPEILQIFGPPFGCGTVAGLSIAGEGYSAESERVRRTNTWKHTLFRREKKIGTITDFVSPAQNVFVREMDLTEGMEWKIDLAQSAVFAGEDAVILPKGSVIYMEYPSRKDTAIVFFADRGKIQGGRVQIPEGRSVFWAASAETVAEARKILESAIKHSASLIRKESEQDWEKYISRIQVSPRKDAEDLERLLATVEDVAVLIRSQQSREGSVLAGYNYHLGYVRDQFG